MKTVEIHLQTLAIVLPAEGKQYLITAHGPENEIVGTVSLKPVSTLMHERGLLKKPHTLLTGQFSRLYVHPDHRGRGLGRRLIETMESICRPYEATALSCYCKAQNHNAIAFYQKLGFNIAFVFEDGDICFSKQLA